MPTKTGRKAAKKAAAKARKAAVERARPAAAGKVARPLPGAKTGKVSAAKAEIGDAPVRQYIASLPAKQREIAERFDALAARTLPGLQRSIKWGMSFYGIGDGWFVSCGGFADHVKVTFLHGTRLQPVPPVGTAKYTRGVDLETVADMDEPQLGAWIKQASKWPGLGAKRR